MADKEAVSISQEVVGPSGGHRCAPSFPCGEAGVLALLPHRDPFVWVSRIVACEPGESIVAELDVDPGLPLFAGHFPNHPVLPGVIVMEALAQAACCCMMAADSHRGKIGYLAGMDKAKFRETVLPGDTVTLEAQIVRASSRFVRAQVTARKGDAVCAQAEQSYVLAPMPRGEVG